MEDLSEIVSSGFPSSLLVKKLKAMLKDAGLLDNNKFHNS